MMSGPGDGSAYCAVPLDDAAFVLPQFDGILLFTQTLAAKLDHLGITGQAFERLP